MGTQGNDARDYVRSPKSIISLMARWICIHALTFANYGFVSDCPDESVN